MPRRLNKKKRQKLLIQIIQRDGDACMLCPEKPVKRKHIDHLDGNIKNNQLENLLLLCQRCNIGEGNRSRSHGRRLITPDNLPEYRARLVERQKIPTQVTRGGEGGGDFNGRVTSLPAPSDWNGYLSPAQANATLMEAYYRLWLYREVAGQGEITSDEATNAGAEFLNRQIGNGSQKTTQRYFDKVTSGEGWLEKRSGSNRPIIWVFRDQVDFGILEVELNNRVLANGGRLKFKTSWLKTESNKG